MDINHRKYRRRVSLLFFAEDRGLKGERGLGKRGKAEDCRYSTIWAMIIDTFNIINEILDHFSNEILEAKYLMA